MPVYSSNIDQSGIIKQFTSSDQFALVEAGVTLVSETDAVFASFDSSGSGVQVINYGDLFGQSTTVFFGLGASNNSVDNFGVIGGGSTGYAAVGLVGDSNGYIMNSGTIFSATNGVYMSGSADALTNSGTVSGTVGVQMLGASETLLNTGKITAPNVGVSVTGTGDTIKNRSMIEGSLDASNSTNTIVRNSGTIDGNVSLGMTGTYDGRGGSVDGVITGGSGVDRIIAGNDGETMNGGAGHDVLYAGAGADTFAFTSFAIADSDHIHDFDVAHDTIQLAQVDFTRLTADASPTFSVATAAASPTDYLFYNSTTGGLYYDPDGSGTKNVPYLVATLDPGLALTAKNFAVV